MLKDSSPLPLAFTAAAAVGSALLVSWFVTRKSSSSKAKDDETLPPCYPHGSLSFFQSLMDPRSPMKLWEIAQDMKTPVFRVPSLLPGFPTFYIVMDHKIARRILEDRLSSKWEPAHELFVKTTKGGNFITEKGHRWKHVRKSTMECFSSQNIAIMTQGIHKVVDTWAKETLDSQLDYISSDENIHIDILKEMNQITASVIGIVAFDYDFTKEQKNELLQNLNTCWVEYGLNMGFNPLKRLPAVSLMFSGIRKAKQASKKMYDMCEMLLQEYRARQATDPQPHKLIHAIANDTSYKNDPERIRDMLAYVIAGFDTAANTLSFGFREMALNPTLQAELRESVRRVGDSMLLKGTVKELLRMYPAAAGTIRVPGRDIPVGDGSKLVIPKDGIVFSSSYGFQRNPSVYKDPDTFFPGRWENPTEEMKRSLLTFAAGSRGCQGQPLATAELHEVLSKLIQKYEFGVVEEGEPANIILLKPLGTILSVKKV